MVIIIAHVSLRCRHQRHQQHHIHLHAHHTSRKDEAMCISVLATFVMQERGRRFAPHSILKVGIITTCWRPRSTIVIILSSRNRYALVCTLAGPGIGIVRDVPSHDD